MRIFSFLFHLLTAAVLLVGPSFAQTNRMPPAPPAPTGAGVIEGRVLGATSGAGVPDVPLEIILRSEPVSFRQTYPARTDSSGAFRVENLPAGHFFIYIQSNEYIVTEDAGEIALAAGERYRSDIFVLTPGSLSGRILDTEGNPVPGAEIQVESPFINVMREVQISYQDEGAFRIAHIPLGEIRLRAVPPEGLLPVENEEERLVQVPTYYPASVNLAGAASIRVQPGENQTAYDVEIQALPAYRVRGEVRDPSGRLAAGATVSLFPLKQGGETLKMGLPGLTAVNRSESFGEKTQSVTTNDEGAFVFDLVPQGDWFVVATVRGNADPEDYEAWRRDYSSASQQIHVLRGDVDRISIQAHRPVPIDIRARELPSGVPDSFRPTLLNAIPLAPSELPPGGRDSKPAEGFATRAELTPGRYYLWLSSTPSTYPSEIFVNGSPAIQPVTITGPTQVEVVYKPADAVLRGRIRGVENSRTTAILLAPEESLSPGATAPLRTVNRDGSYRIENLAPGAYYVLAADGTTLRTPSVIREHGKRVQLKSGETVDLDLDFTRLDP